ncbi:signal peptidase I [Brevibacillus ginsengisoli]|uniref:signal peptidase I n=1 Tax=Brevibacillus ginsengisoli TaxID=363854 RepID=UPI003CFAD0EA
MNRVVAFMKEWFVPIAIALALSFTVRVYIAEAVEIPSGSMIPTLQVNDRLFIEKVTDPSNLHVGDIVVFYPPVQGKEERFIKRLIGVGGDKIEVKDGALYRNDQKVDEPYIKEPMNYSYGPIVVPKGKFFFLGDNRNDSFDSHLWPTPFVDKGAIIGKAVFRYYPLNEMKEFVK